MICCITLRMSYIRSNRSRYENIKEEVAWEIRYAVCTSEESNETVSAPVLKYDCGKRSEVCVLEDSGCAFCSKRRNAELLERAVKLSVEVSLRLRVGSGLKLYRFWRTRTELLESFDDGICSGEESKSFEREVDGFRICSRGGNIFDDSDSEGRLKNRATVSGFGTCTNGVWIGDGWDWGREIIGISHTGGLTVLDDTVENVSKMYNFVLSVVTLRGSGWMVV